MIELQVLVVAGPHIGARPRPFRNSSFAHGETCELPEYDLIAWASAYPSALPDHPCIFRHRSLSAAIDLITPEADFLRRYGNESARAEPVYAQAGGYLGSLHMQLHHGRPSESGRTATVGELIAKWAAPAAGSEAGEYVADFNCQTRLCHAVVRSLDMPSFLANFDVVTTNMLLGGIGSGLPFHWHAQTWQLQIHGRKAWHLVPPGRMGANLAHAVGPMLVPATVWSKALGQLPLGQRPLFCLQRPGEVIYFPDNWWHATENRDAFTFAYGEKPTTRHHSSGGALNVHGWAEKAISMFTEKENPSPFKRWWDAPVRLRLSETRLASGEPHPLSTAIELLDNMTDGAASAASVGGAAAVRAFNGTFAFALCVFASSLRHVKPGTPAATLVDGWKHIALETDSATYARECASSRSKG